MAWINGEWVMTSHDHRLLERAEEIGRRLGVSMTKSFDIAEAEIREEDRQQRKVRDK